jgi:hypothetical protein
MPGARELIQLWSELDTSTERQNFKTLWQEINDFVLTRKTNVVHKQTKGSRRTERLQEGTAPHSAGLLAATLQGSLTSNSVFWFNIRMREKELNENENVKEWLDDSTRRMYNAFNDSNFRIEIHEMFTDIVTVGTACLLTEKAMPGSENVLNFRSYFVGDDFVIREDAQGYVDTVIRKVCFSARQAFQLFGDKAGKTVLEAIKKKVNMDFDFLHVAMPIKEYSDTRKGFGNDLWEYTDIYVSMEDEVITKKAGYFEFPYIIPRWSKASGEMYGRSPSFTALPDIRTLNAATSYMQQAWAKDIKPSRLVPEGLGVDIDDVPGTNIPVPAHLIEAIKKGALTSDARWEVSAQERQDLRTAIKECYFTDQIQLQKQAQMTATESTIIFELMQRLLGPVFGRLESQLAPMVERAFGIMFRAGEFLPMPAELEESTLDIEYVGPLARSQRMSEINALRQWLEQLVQIAAVKPDITDVPNFDEIARDSARMLNVNERYVNDEDTIADIRGQREQAEQEAQQIENASTAADAFAKVAKVGNA